MKAEIKINNMPEEIHHPYIVVRRIEDTTLWYWGAYDDENSATAAAVEIRNGFVVRALGDDSKGID